MDRRDVRPVGIRVEMIGVPDSVVAAFKRHASGPIIHAPPRREPVAPVTRRRERRAITRRSASSRGSPDEPHEPGPQLHVIPPSAFRAELDRLLEGETA